MHLKLVAVAALVSFFANWQFAYQITYVNTAVGTFFVLANHAYSVTENCTQCLLPYESWSTQWSLIVASFYPGTIIGFLVVPTLADRFGVRRSFILTCIPAILGCILQLTARLAANTNLVLFDVVLCVGRILVGVQAGSSLCLLPLFVIEISPMEYRSLLSTFQQASQSLSTVIGFVIGSEHLLNMGAYRFEWMQAIALVPSLAFSILLLSLPETPRHCFLHTCDFVKVSKAVTFYHGHRDVLNARRQLLLETGGSRYGREEWNPAAIKGLLLGCIAAISFAFTADDLIDTFSAYIIHSTNGSGTGEQTDLRSELLTILLGVILVLSSVFGSLLIDKYGRRPLLIAGLIGTSLSNSIVAINRFLTSPILTAIAFALTKCFIGLGAGAPAWFLTSELVPPGMMLTCQTLSTGLLLITTGVITLLFLTMERAFSTLSILIVASGPALISAILLFVFLPETRNKPYAVISAELDAHFFSGLHATLPFGSLETDYGSIDNDDQT
uniref:Major facilitator superfamily (MFS) profile domain-containing protein n=1 Tax=Parascaris univalens TaxID=6257 RepID=A0A915C113_PARUN